VHGPVTPVSEELLDQDGQSDLHGQRQACRRGTVTGQPRTRAGVRSDPALLDEIETGEQQRNRDQAEDQVDLHVLRPELLIGTGAGAWQPSQDGEGGQHGYDVAGDDAGLLEKQVRQDVRRAAHR
jgi:hypothetical protein